MHTLSRFSTVDARCSEWRSLTDPPFMDHAAKVSEEPDSRMLRVRQMTSLIGKFDFNQKHALATPKRLRISFRDHCRTDRFQWAGK